MNILETPRLALRAFIAGDIGALAPLLAHPEVMRYSMTGPMNSQQAKALLDAWIATYHTKGYSPLALINERQMIGYAGFDDRVIDAEKHVQITFRIAHDHWGKGFSTEIIAPLLDYGFSRLHLKEIVGLVDPENKISIRILTRAGMQLSQTVNYEGSNLHLYKRHAQTTGNRSVTRSPG